MSHIGPKRRFAASQSYVRSSGVKPTCRHRSNDAIGPKVTSNDNRMIPNAIPIDALFACGAAELPVEISLGIELLKVCPQVFGLFFVLDAGEHLFGPGNLCLRIFDVSFKSFLIPDESRVFVRIRVIEFGNAAGEAAVKSIEFGTDPVCGARADFVADSAFLKSDRTLVNVLRKRQVS